MPTEPRILVAGAGAMGTALAGIVGGRTPTALWCRRPELAAALARSRENAAYLPGYRLPAEVSVISGMLRAEDFSLVILAFPTQHLREQAGLLGLAGSRRPLVVSTAKGLEIGTRLTPCGLLADLGLAEARLFALSGPSHAEEMCRGIPTSVVLAGGDEETRQNLLPLLSGQFFRPYGSNDRLGVELGGALKNVIAIAAGIADGLGFGMNTKSAIVTRGLAEIRRYGAHRGADPQTFSGLSCLGDLVTTCCSPYSRNRAFGESLVRGERFTKLAEGQSTAAALVAEIAGLGFDMPLCRAVHAVITGRVTPQEAIRLLLDRPLKTED